MTGGTQAFFSDFFPAAYGRLTSGYPRLWAVLQPAWLADACPEGQASLPLPAALAGLAAALGQDGTASAAAGGPPLVIRNPALLPFQLAGLAVGLWGAARLAGPRNALLRCSLLLFSAMNASSILCHTLAARGSALWRGSLAADVGFTGASSLCLLASQVLPAPAKGASAAAAYPQCLALFLALLAGVAAFGDLPWVPEAVYLGTTVLAAAVTGARLLLRWAAAGRAERAWLAPRLLLAAVAVSGMESCLALDPVLCRLAGSWLGTVSVLFGASALGFAAIVLLSEERAGARRNGAKLD